MNNSIAVVHRGNCCFSDKSRNAAANGAVGVLIVDNTAHMYFGHVGDALSIPTVIIGNSAGLAIAKDILKSNSSTVGSILDSDEHSLKINVDTVYHAGFGRASGYFSGLADLKVLPLASALACCCLYGLLQ